jgi:hypothetical protein
VTLLDRRHVAEEALYLRRFLCVKPAAWVALERKARHAVVEQRPVLAAIWKKKLAALSGVLRLPTMGVEPRAMVSEACVLVAVLVEGHVRLPAMVLE